MRPFHGVALPSAATSMRSRRTILGVLTSTGLSLGAAALPDRGAAKKKHKKHKKTCPPCQQPDTCPDRVCCECHALGPIPGCHIVRADSNPSPPEVIAACDQACGGHQHVIGGRAR